MVEFNHKRNSQSMKLYYRFKRLVRLAFPSAAERKFMRVMPWWFFLIYRPKREHIIGGYMADFAIPSRKLIIEIDGHEYHKDHIGDWVRDQRLGKRGWTTLRIKATDLWQQPRSVRKRVLKAVKW